MLTKTKVDLANKVLSLLGKTGEGQTPSDDDLSLVTDLIDPACETLSGLSVIVIDDTDAIAINVFLPLADYIAEQCASDFSRPKNVQAEQIAIRELRMITRTLPTYEQMKAEYF
jgi:hypothetical protein